MEARTATGPARKPARTGFIAGIRTPLLRHQPDHRLVALTREGSDAAFETLVRRYQSRLVGFAESLLGRSSTDAEDVVQEVMLAANAAMVADDRPLDVRPWLYKITRNRCLNHLRDQSAARRPPVNGDGQDQLLLDAIASGGASTADEADSRAELQLLVHDLRSLPEAQRTAIIMREVDGLSYQEVAEAMNTTVSSVKSLLVRARLALVEIVAGRELRCEDVRTALAKSEQKLGGLSGAERAHVRGCENCAATRKRLRATSRSLGALAPVGLVGPLSGVVAGGSGSAGAAAGAAGGGGGGATLGSGAAAGGFLAGGGLAAKGLLAVLTATVVAAGSVYLPAGGGSSDGSAAPDAATDVAAPVVHTPAGQAHGASQKAVAADPKPNDAGTGSAADAISFGPAPAAAGGAVDAGGQKTDHAVDINAPAGGGGGQNDADDRGAPGLGVDPPTQPPVTGPPPAGPPADPVIDPNIPPPPVEPTDEASAPQPPTNTETTTPAP